MEHPPSHARAQVVRAEAVDLLGADNQARAVGLGRSRLAGWSLIGESHDVQRATRGRQPARVGGRHLVPPGGTYPLSIRFRNCDGGRAKRDRKMRFAICGAWHGRYFRTKSDTRCVRTRPGLLIGG